MPPTLYNSLFMAGHEVRWFKELESTNDYIVNLARDSDTEVDRDRLAGLVVVSDYQSKGRGRMDREWLAPPGRCLLMSILVPATTIPDNPFLIVSAVSLAVVEACMETVSLHVDIAWPNDLYVGGKKLGGILTEIVGGLPYLVVGIGLNVTWPAIAGDGVIEGASAASDQLEGESTLHSTNTATSILLESEELVDRRYLLERILVWMDRHLEEATMPNGIADLLKEYRERCITVGKCVSVSLVGGRVVEGTAIAIDSNGRLNVESGSGVEVFSSGDVRIIR